MSISNPAHWKEPTKARGDKYNKIVEIITALNLLKDVEKALLIGSANAGYVPCMFLEAWNGSNNLGYMVSSGLSFQRAGNAFYSLPLPLNRGGKSLYIQKLKLIIFLADADDYVDVVYLYGRRSAASATQLYTDPTNRTAGGTYIYSFAAVDVSSYFEIIARIQNSFATAGQLVVSAVQIEGYYA